MTPEEIKTMYMTYAESHIKHSLDEIVPSSSSSFKKHLNTLLNEYIDKHATHFIETSPQLSDFKYENAEGFVPVDISALNNILSNTIRIAEILSDNYIQHKQLFKQAFHKEGKDGFKPLETKNTEELSDGMDRVIYRNKVRKYANSFLRSYKNLLNEDSFRLFSRIYDGDYDRDFVQKQIRKIASFKDENDLTNALTKIIESEHSVDYVKHKIEDHQLNADIIYSDEEHIILDIKDFKASQILGSSQWCISNQEPYFNDYLFGASLAKYHGDYDEPELAKQGNQIFCYNFALDASDPEFMIGLTIANNGTLYAAHDNDDQDIMVDIIDEDIDVDPAIFEYIKNTKPYSPKKIVDNLKNTPSFIYDDDYLSLNYRNPLNLLVNIENNQLEEYGMYSFERFNSKISFDFTIIRKSIDDFNTYHDISKSEMFDDLIKAYPILKKMNEVNRQKSKNKTLFIDEIATPDIISNEKYWECIETNQLLENLDSIELDVNYRKNESIIRDVFYDFDEKLKDGFENATNDSVFMEGKNFKNYKNSFIRKMLPFVIDDKKLSNYAKSTLSFLYVAASGEKDNEKITDYFIDAFKIRNIHINKVISPDTWKTISPNIQKKIVNAINENNDVIQNITEKDMETFLTNPVFSDLNSQSLKKIKERFEENPNTKTNLEDCVNILSTISGKKVNKDLFPINKENKRQKKLKA